MNKNYFASIIVVAALSFTSTAFTQTTQTIKGAQQLNVAYVDVSPPIRDIQVFTDRKSTYEAKEIKNRFDNTKHRDDNSENFISDPVVQDYVSSSRSAGPTIDRVYEGVSNAENQSVRGGRITPPDTQGDVGPNHYVQMTNLLTKIFDLNTNTLVLGPFTNSTFWTGFIYDGIDFGARNDGDPIVLYDQFEDRWIVSQFETLHDYILIAVSQTGDPTGSYYRYAIAYPNFPDYPKFGIWGDAIYITTRDFGGGYLGSSVAGLQKTGLYDGTGANGFIISILNSAYNHDGILPADADGTLPPPAGTPHFSMFKPDGSHDYLYLAETTPDWNNTANSSMTISTIPVASYLSASGLVYQPNGRGLHAHTWALMYRLQYRNFGTHQTIVANHTVKATSAGAFGIRWYEFRAPLNTSTWTAYQQGTFLPADGENRWMGSIAMNGNGDIALGYSLTSGATFPSIRFTGQSASMSGTGIMDLPETSIFAGTASLDGAGNRWGDYSMMSVDPTGDEKFWYTTEYALGAVNWADWATKIAEFSLNPFAGPAMIAVTPPSLTFTVGLNGTDSDLLNIANTGLSGTADLNWSLNFAEPVPPLANSGDGNNNEQEMTSKQYELYDQSNDQILAQKLAMAEEDKNRNENPLPMLAGGPDVFGYTFIDSDEPDGPVFSWTDITISGTEIISNGDYDFSSFGGADDAYKQIALPFTFNFYGVDQSLVKVSSNGYLTFGIDGSDFSNDPIPSGSDPNDIICPFWDDLNPAASGTIHFLTTPSQLIIQYTNLERFSNGSSLTFQVILNDDGSMIYQYLDMQGVLNSATIGIENNDASSGLQVVHNSSYVHNNLAVLISPPVPPCPWLSLSPESGTLAAGTNQDVTVSVDAAGLDYGTYDCELTITSNATNASQVVVPVTLVVADIVPPVITVVDPITLWPPNRKYENFDLSELVVSVEDNVDGTIPVSSVVITSASSDEPDNAPGNGDGNTVNDIVIAADCKTIDLRKERNGTGNGRVYEVNVSVADASGNVGTATCLVMVPHDQNHAPINDGPDYTVYSNCGDAPATQTSLVAGIGDSFENNYEVINYPNPFSGTTTIQFRLTESSYTKLVVFNSLGSEVAKLYDGMATADQVYKVEFNALDMVGGVYFYRLQSGENVNTMNKMMLVK